MALAYGSGAISSPVSFRGSGRAELCGYDSFRPLASIAVLQPVDSPANEALPAQERLKSCNPTVATAAAKEIVSAPETFKQPLELFSVSEALFLHGKKDEAVFWFYAAQLGMRYQLAVEPGDGGQLLAIMMMAIGPAINNYAFQNLTNLDRILDRVLEWDRKAPNPDRDQARSADTDAQIKQIYTGLRDFKTKLASEREQLERNARLAAPVNLRCSKNQIDPAYAAQATREEWALATGFVKNHQQVISEAGGITQVYPESSLLKRTDVMPYRYIVSVVGAKRVHAVLDVSRSSGRPNFTLACVSHIAPGNRDPFKDVCAQ